MNMSPWIQQMPSNNYSYVSQPKQKGLHSTTSNAEPEAQLEAGYKLFKEAVGM